MWELNLPPNTPSGRMMVIEEDCSSFPEITINERKEKFKFVSRCWLEWRGVTGLRSIVGFSENEFTIPWTNPNPLCHSGQRRERSLAPSNETQTPLLAHTPLWCSERFSSGVNRNFTDKPQRITQKSGGQEGYKLRRKSFMNIYLFLVGLRYGT